MAIHGFFGKYRWLSNFWACTLNLSFEGVALYFNCVEEAYHACKSKDVEVRRMFCGVGPCEAKHMGRQVQLRDDWNEVRLDLMYFLVKQKFKQNPSLWEQLDMTDSQYLEESNTWNDRFWGVCNNIGQNQLGKILFGHRQIQHRALCK